MEAVKKLGKGVLLAALSALLALCWSAQTRAEDVVIKTQAAADSVPGGIRGVDVSHYQESIDWAKVAGDNISFAIVRASVGREVDSRFHENVTGAAANGLHVGAYHYGKFSDRASMAAEAEFFLNQIAGYTFTYPVVLDIEDNSANRKLSSSELTALCIDFLELVRERGYRVMLYSGTNFLDERLELPRLSGYDLWVANYVEEPVQGQKLWQHTSVGTVNGIDPGRALIDIAYTDLSAKRSITVDRDISNSIKSALNQRYGAGLPMDGLDMAEMRRAVISGLQQELVSQLGAQLSISGELDAATLDALGAISFTYGETQGNITYLVQVMLFYKGYYAQPLNSTFDSYMAQALTSYQQQSGLPASGVPDSATLRGLLG